MGAPVFEYGEDTVALAHILNVPAGVDECDHGDPDHDRDGDAVPEATPKGAGDYLHSHLQKPARASILPTAWFFALRTILRGFPDSTASRSRESLAAL
jgi:hypothetical protein